MSLLALATAEVYFDEPFSGSWKDRWVSSDWKKDEGTNGKWGWSHGDFYGDAQEDKGLMTKQDARYYAISAKMDKKFDNEGKDLVIQYSVKLPSFVDCGGGYIKVMRSGTDQKSFSGSSDYAVMFGTDICGTTTRKIQAILNYKDENLLKKTEVPCETDKFTHFNTFIIRPDNTYTIKIDNVEKASGSLYDEWPFLKPKKIADPDAKMPSDWVDEPLIDDPNDKKPDDWVEVAKIPDPEAKMPEDWDEEADGEWTPPMIPNESYKGEWKPKKIPNPDYQGKWVAPEIDNPDFVDDPEIYVQKDLEYVGFELWQMKSNWIFDNILVTDDVTLASERVEAWLKKNKAAESKMNEDIEAEERKKAEAQRKAAESKTDDKDDDEIDLDDDEKDEL